MGACLTLDDELNNYEVPIMDLKQPVSLNGLYNIINKRYMTYIYINRENQ